MSISARPAIVCWAWLAAGALLASCGDGEVADRDLGPLVVAPKPVVTEVAVARLNDPVVLGAALAAAPDPSALGAHRLIDRVTTEVSENGTVVERYTDETTLELWPDGRFHATMLNGADYGREVIFDGTTLFLRPRYSRWHARAPEAPTEPKALIRSFAENPLASWELVAPAVALKVGADAPLAGRPARAVSISLDASLARREAPAETLPQRAWRATRVIEAAVGELTIDIATGGVLAARLQGQISFARDGRRFTLKSDVTREVAMLPADHALTLPDTSEVVATPGRLGEVDDRDFILDKLAPPTRAGDRTPADDSVTKP